jgi:Zn-dependent peptidase ImmA (M78 family)
MVQAVTKTMKIMGRDLMVIYVDQIPDKDADTIGLYDGNQSIIYIKKGLTPNHEKRTLIHELVHAMLCVSGQRHHFKDKTEEAICDLMENLAEFISL